MSDQILVFGETKSGKVRKVVLELLAKAGEMKEEYGGEVSVLLVGGEVEKAADELSRFVDSVYVMERPELASYSSEIFSEILSELAERLSPALVLGGATAVGRDLFPRAAALLDAPCLSDVLSVDKGVDGWVRAKRALYGGRIHQDLSFDFDRAAFITVRPNIYPVKELEETAEPSIVVLEKEIDEGIARCRVVGRKEVSTGRIDLNEADVVVGVGRGIGGAENFAMVEELADALKAAVAVTRGVVDNEWRPHDEQVGKSGKTISPGLYVSFGVSGAVHHTMGIESAKTVIAVNKDPDALIFQHADYGLVGDLFEIIPWLKAELKRNG